MSKIKTTEVQESLDHIPMFFGQNIIRYESFISDFNKLMSDEETNLNFFEIMLFLADKYELKNMFAFNRQAFSFLVSIFYQYKNAYMNRVNRREDITGEDYDNITLLRKHKG